MTNTWLYIQSEPKVFTVGFYKPSGEWEAESDHTTRSEAAARVHYLNGGIGVDVKAPKALEGDVYF